MRHQAVILDMDGVLTDSEPVINEAVVTLFHRRGVPIASYDFLPIVAHCVRPSLAEVTLEDFLHAAE